MSSPPIIIQITQDAINTIVSGETEITPRKIVEILGESYDEGSNYIFTINETITIPPGKTLKDFENIVVNPETGNVTIRNKGTIDNCNINFNANDVNGYLSTIGNDGNITSSNITLSSTFFQNYNYGRISGGNITLSDDSKFYNNGNITGSSITLSSSSIFYNNSSGNITGSSITLSSSSIFYNNISGNITGSNITLSSSSIFYNNSSGNITGSNITLSSSSKFYNYVNGKISNSYIFLHNKAIFHNFYIDNDDRVYYGTLTNSYIFAFDNCQILNTYDNRSGTFNNTFILKYSDKFYYDDEELSDKIVNNPATFELNILADTIVLLASSITPITNVLNDRKKELEAEKVSLENQKNALKTEEKTLNNQKKEFETEIETLNSDIEKINSEINQLKNTNWNNINENITVKDNTLSKLILLSYLTQKDNSNVL